MKRFNGIFVLAFGLLAIGTIGCGPAYVQPPVAVNSAAPQEVISGTCINNMQQVMEDYYCDPSWIAQQRSIAMQQNNQALLNSLLLYHMIYTSNPYSVGAYIPHSVVVYNSPPRNYIVQRRSVYVTNVNNHSINYSGGRATTVVRSSTYSKPQTTSSFGQRNSSWSSNTTRTSSTPVSRPTTSYSRPSSSSFGSSSFSRPSSSSSFSRSSSSSSFGSRRR